jgi:hypothetical protein
MHAVESTQARELNAAEIDDVSGGFIWIAAFAIGAAVGYGCRKAGDATVEWFFGDDD